MKGMVPILVRIIVLFRVICDQMRKDLFHAVLEIYWFGEHRDAFNDLQHMGYVMVHWLQTSFVDDLLWSEYQPLLFTDIIHNMLLWIIVCDSNIAPKSRLWGLRQQVISIHKVSNAYVQV
jgi:hypothetical protein